MYGYVRYLLPDDTPTPMVKYVRLTHYANSNLFHDKLTGNYVMGIIHLDNKTPLDWYSKKQVNLETSAYGYEFVYSFTCV